LIDTAVFLVAGAACLVGALGVVLARNPVHSALMLAMTLFGIAVLFVAQEAHFLAAVQVIVYAGAIVVLFLFVIMLLGVDKAQALALRVPRSQPVAAVVFAVAMIALLIGIAVATENPATGTQALGGALDSGAENIRLLAHSLFDQYVYAFELTSALLVIAVIGAVVLARRPRRDLMGEIDDGADD
jgi:NADH-quinone oxidoreductase subunit J